MESIDIIFCNFYHIGDTHFAQPFVKNIVKNNPNHKYYIFNHYNTFCYLNQINNIKDINDYIDLKNKVSNILGIHNYNNIDHQYNNSEIINKCEIPKLTPYFTTIYNSDLKILLINTWIGCLLETYPILETNFISYSKSYHILTNNINITYNLNLIHDISDNSDILPSIDKIYIESFINIKNDAYNKNKKVIFYYNYVAKSGQQFPINNEDEHNTIIKYLSLKYIVIIPHKNLYLDNYIKENNIDSIIFAEDLIFIDEYYSCRNLYYFSQMAYDSDISIYFDSGRNFLYANKNFINNPNDNIRIYFSNNIKYYQNINDPAIIPKEYMQYIQVYNYNDILNYFKRI